jgi:O-antigen ligase
LLLVYMLRSQHKLLFMAIGGVVGVILAYYTSDRWLDRISTISNYQADSSAYVRILVWKWTWGFVQSHPMGGGFSSYVINAVTLPPDAHNPHGSTQFGRAFHSSYFEVLGEHGFPGMALFLGAAGLATLATFSIGRKVRDIPELQWCGALAIAIQAGLAVFLTAGAFVGLAFQPMFWYFVAMSVCLKAYVHRCLSDEVKVKTGWREMARDNLAGLGGGRGGGRSGPIPVGVASRKGAVRSAPWQPRS